MSTVSYRDILRHRANGLSLKDTAATCKCARSTVQDVLSLAKEKGVTWEDVKPLTDAGAYELIRGKPPALELFAPIDFKHVSEEMNRDRTMKLTILWEEYAINAAETGKRPYQYSRFCEKYDFWCEANDIAVTRRYVLGDIGEFDWAGKKMALCDIDDGTIIDIPVFVACYPYSLPACRTANMSLFAPIAT